MIEGVGDGVMLTGTAASPADSQQAFDIASRLVGASTKVVNGITVRGRDQVMLKVTVAEVQRDVIKQLGIDLSGSLNYGTAVVNFNSSNPFSASGTSPTLQPDGHVRRQPEHQGHAQRHGARRRDPHAGRAEPDRDFRRNRELRRRRRIPDPDRTVLRRHAQIRRPVSRTSRSRNSASA